MDLSEMTIQYQGFHPTDFTKDYLEAMMDELYSESPHGSFFQSVFSRQNHIFKARVRIDSGNGHFFAVASGRKLKEVTHRVVYQIRKQLGKRKSLRFNKRASHFDSPYFKEFKFSSEKELNNDDYQTENERGDAFARAGAAS